MFFTERLSPFLKLIDYWSFFDQPAIILWYYNNKVNHLVFGDSSCLWCVSRKLSDSNKYSGYRHARPTNLMAPKKFPSSISMFPREIN